MYYHNLRNNIENFMYIYLPIAEQPIHSLAILGIGAFLGLIMGLVGVGGGFLLTPLMMFLGIPPPVAVASLRTNWLRLRFHVLSHWKRSNVDFKMGTVLLLGGIVGSSIGVILFNFLGKIGQLDFVIKSSYVIFLTLIGTLMFSESLGLILRTRKGKVTRGKLHQHNWLHGLPFKIRFRKSKLYISILLPILSGYSWYSCCFDGYWWWFYYSTSNDISFGYANIFSGRHIFISNYFCCCKHNYFTSISKSNC